MKDRAEAFLQDEQYEEGQCNLAGPVKAFQTSLYFKAWRSIEPIQHYIGGITECCSPAAIKDFETAKEHSENDRQIKEGLERAQKLLKQSQKRDYYKILGVKRLDIRNNNLVYFLLVWRSNFHFIKLCLQDCPEKGDLESVQKVGAAVASG